jgi:uncharacterized protein YegL
MAEQLPFAAAAEFANNPEPRCPCVLLLDVSYSMSEVVRGAGAATGEVVQRDGQAYQIVAGGTTRIDLLNDGLQAYKDDLTADTLASQRVEVCVMTFGGRVETVTPFVTADQFTPPTLTAAGDTPMGAAIDAALDAVAERKRMYREHGVPYYRPWVFLITDGGPTDAWRTAAKRVREAEEAKQVAFFAVGVEGANFDTLKQIAVRKPLSLKGMNFRELFVWLSQSQRAVSQSQVGGEDKVALPSPAGWAGL